jgi:hypothetical protein
MSLRFATVFVFLIAVASLVRTQGKAQDRADDFAKLGQPGPEHEKLKALLGTWELTMPGAGSGAKGTAVYKSLYGGRFITEEAKMPFGEKTMEWLGIYGYDKNKKKYTAVWVDNMDTTTESAAADADPTGTVFRFRGEHLDPRSGKLAKYSWRISLGKDDSLQTTMFEDTLGSRTGSHAVHRQALAVSPRV